MPARMSTKGIELSTHMGRSGIAPRFHSNGDSVSESKISGVRLAISLSHYYYYSRNETVKPVSGKLNASHEHLSSTAAL